VRDRRRTGDESHREPLARFGHALGMAFQIVDDLLDFTESEAMVGKPTGQDLREHKVTLPLIAAMREMPAAERRDVERFFADPVPSDDGIEHVTRLVRDNGGLEYARNRADEFGRRPPRRLLELPDGRRQPLPGGSRICGRAQELSGGVGHGTC
jgi:octaprenyl-diphosphate synthase